MICENCKQRPATITLTQVKNGQQITKHYCEICSQQLHQHDHSQNEHVPLQQLFADWFGIPTWSANAPKSQQQEEHLICPNCGVTYKQFLHDGKFNCPTCYDAFRDELPQVMKRLHNGATRHVGKMPGAVNATYKLKQEIEGLRNDMKKAVEEERFEDAATLRDQARKLEKELHGGDLNG